MGFRAKCILNFVMSEMNYLSVGRKHERDFVKFVCKDVAADAVRRQVCWS